MSNELDVTPSIPPQNTLSTSKVVDWRSIPIPPIPSVSREGRLRNKPCPCGSGKKMKRCCLKKREAEVQAAVVAQRGLRMLKQSALLSELQDLRFGT